MKGCRFIVQRNRFFAFFLAMVFCLQLSGCVFPDFTKVQSDSEKEELETEPIPETPKTELPKEYVYDGSQGALSLYGYSQLNDAQKQAYAVVCQGIENFQEEIVGPFEVTPGDFQDVLFAVFADHPEYFWAEFTLCDTVSYSVNLKVLVSRCSVRYLMSREKAESYKKMIEDRSAEILAPTKEMSSEYQIVKYLHDYIIDHADYNSASVGKYAPSDRLKGKYNYPEEYHSSYSILGFYTQDKFVCAGYAKLFEYLLAKAGIWATYVIGNSKDEGHAWNIVRLDEDYYCFDVTWDDPVNEDGSGGNLVYDYFGLTTEEISADHTFDTFYYPYPECTAQEYHYYRYNGRYVEFYSYDLFYRAISSAAANGEDGVEFQFSSESVFENCYRILFDDEAVFDILKNLPRGPKPFSRSTVRTNVNEEKLRLMISFVTD